MITSIKNQLLETAKFELQNNDVAHDFEHALRVLSNAENIAREEHADLDVIIPAALFHDLIVYPKNHPEKHKSQEESALKAAEILTKLPGYPQEKIELVKTCILECSFSKGIIPNHLESKILQDADGLEATGAIAVMRTYATTGQLNRAFYSIEDTFCTERTPDTKSYALDLFFERLLKAKERMHTAKAKQIAERRTEFLKDFLAEFKIELEGK